MVRAAVFAFLLSTATVSVAEQVYESGNCVASPNCRVRNRVQCAEPHDTCGPCLEGFVSKDTDKEWANIPCERDVTDPAIIEEALKDFEIPTIDLTPFASLDNPDLEEARKIEAEKVFKACMGPGFLYFVNHGISPELIEKVYADSAAFFSKSLSEKMKYEWEGASENSGYVRIGHESLDEDNKEAGDPKEAYDMNKQHLMAHPVWNKTSLVDYWNAANSAKNLVLRAFAESLELKDPNWLVDSHKEEWNTLRLLHYPAQKGPLADKYKYRAGAHSDYGTVTLLLQDSTGGLEVFHRELGVWLPVPPKEGTMVVNVADLLMRWTNDNFASTLHRVVAPKHGSIRSRYTLVYFVNPDEDYVIDTKELAALTDKLDIGLSEMAYPPVTSRQYLEQRLEATYNDDAELEPVLEEETAKEL